MMIYIVRHAQTEANKMGVIQGQTDSALTETGRQQIKESAEYFRGIDVSAIYASPLGRTMQSAGFIADAAGIDRESIVALKELMEIDLKPWVNKKIVDLYKDESLSGYKTYRNRPELFTAADGENLIDVQKRMVNVFHKILNAHPKDSNVVIVCHSMTIRTLLVALEGKTFADVWSYRINPASITKVNVGAHSAVLEFVGLCPYEPT